MKKKSTPETDQCWDKYINFPYTYGAGDIRILAQRLERERDEARTTIEDAKRALNATNYEGILLAALRVKEERDEARHKLELCMAANSDVARIAKERDEAREQNAKLREIAESAIDWLNLGNPDDIRAGTHIRAKLDQLNNSNK